MKKLLILGAILFIVVTGIIIYLLIPYDIKLNGDKVITINYKDIYNEEGAYLTKLNKKINKDIKITGKVDTTKLGEYTITYSYKDQKKVRKVIVKDLEKPTLTLNKDDITLFVNDSEYIEYGANATDNYDKDIKIKIDNNVNTSIIGEYEVKYTACDSSNNCNEVIRKVNITKGDIIYGKYSSKVNNDGTIPSILKLNGQARTFTLDVNLCFGMSTIKGTYTQKDNVITLNFKPHQYSGATSETDTKYQLYILNDDYLKFATDTINCGPNYGTLFEKK